MSSLGNSLGQQPLVSCNSRILSVSMLCLHNLNRNSSNLLEPLHGDNSRFYHITAFIRKDQNLDLCSSLYIESDIAPSSYLSLYTIFNGRKRWHNCNDHFCSERRTENTPQFLIHTNVYIPLGSLMHISDGFSGYFYYT